MSEQGNKMVHLQRHNYDRYVGFQQGSSHPVTSLNENGSLKTKELEKRKICSFLEGSDPRNYILYLQIPSTVNPR